MCLAEECGSECGDYTSHVDSQAQAQASSTPYTSRMTSLSSRIVFLRDILLEIVGEWAEIHLLHQRRTR